MPHDRDKKPTPAPEAAPAFDPDRLPRLRPAFMLTPDDRPAKPAPRKPAPAPVPRKRTGEDWRARTLAERANESPPRAEEPARESQAALRAFLDAAEAEAQIETPLAEDEQD